MTLEERMHARFEAEFAAELELGKAGPGMSNMRKLVELAQRMAWSDDVLADWSFPGRNLLTRRIYAVLDHEERAKLRRRTVHWRERWMVPP